MAHVLLIDNGRNTLRSIEETLRAVGHAVETVASGFDALQLTARVPFDRVIIAMPSRDMSAFDLLQALKYRDPAPSVALVDEPDHARDERSLIGVVGSIEQPASKERVLSAVDAALVRHRHPAPDHGHELKPEAHAATRWARAIVPLVDCPRDPRTIADWGRWIAASPGAIRNWCFTVGVAPRRSLVFGRLLRAVVLNHDGLYKPENLLDVVDRRTLAGLLKFASLDGERGLPSDLGEFLRGQILVRDAEVLLQVEKEFEKHSATRVR